MDVPAGGHRVEVVKVSDGVDRVLLRNSQGATAMVSLYGAQVLSWKTHQGEELLFTSRKAILNSTAAVRGGISICFPEFESRGRVERHGYVRNRTWIINNGHPWPPLDNEAYVDLLLKPSEDDLKVWPHRFEFHLRVSLNGHGHLILISRVRNVSGKPFSFSTGFHTYFSVSDISDVRIEGLESFDYLDNLCGNELFTDYEDALTFESESELDRVYIDTPKEVAVFDHGKMRTFFIKKQGLPDMVVWNPWEKTAKAMADFGNDEYERMVCVDGAAIERPIILRPGEEWTGRVEFSFIPPTSPQFRVDEPIPTSSCCFC